MDRIHEESVRVLEMLLDHVDDYGNIDTHTWYRGISNDIKNALRVSIDTIQSIDKLYEELIKIYASLEDEKKTSTIFVDALNPTHVQINSVIIGKSTMYEILLGKINEVFGYGETEDDNPEPDQEE